MKDNMYMGIYEDGHRLLHGERGIVSELPHDNRSVMKTSDISITPDDLK